MEGAGHLQLWKVGPTEFKELVLFQALHMVLGCRSVETQDEIKCQQHSRHNPHYEMYQRWKNDALQPGTSDGEGSSCLDPLKSPKAIH